MPKTTIKSLLTNREGKSGKASRRISPSLQCKSQQQNLLVGVSMDSARAYSTYVEEAGSEVAHARSFQRERLPDKVRLAADALFHSCSSRVVATLFRATRSQGVILNLQTLRMSARSVAASYKPPMLVTRARLPACAFLPHHRTTKGASRTPPDAPPRHFARVV